LRISYIITVSGSAAKREFRLGSNIGFQVLAAVAKRTFVFQVLMAYNPVEVQRLSE
jgi:hypothetical protein